MERLHWSHSHPDWLQTKHIGFNAGPNDRYYCLRSRYVSFVHFLPSSNYYYGSEPLLMTSISTKRTSSSHIHTTHLLSHQRDVSFLFSVLARRDLRGGRGVSEDLWREGENLTVLINEYRLTDSFKPLTKSTRTRRGRTSTPHNDDDGTTQHLH